MKDTSKTPGNPNNREKLEEIRKSAMIRHPQGAAPPAPAPVPVLPMPANGNSRSDGFGMIAVPTEVPQGGSVGALLRFRKGEYVTDRGMTVVPVDTIVIARDVTEQFVRWENQERAETITRLPDRPFPNRSELGHLDPEKWPLGPDGKPSDPWTLTLYVLMFDSAALKDYTFTTSTFGGTKAVRQLCRHVDYKREASGISDLLACVRLAVGRWTSKKYGLILSPEFPIVGWVSGDLRPIAEISLAEEIDDSNPF